MQERYIFHVDVNNAFLSWTAAYRLRILGERTDLRQIPAVVAGDRESRKGVVLAKSTPAKKYGIQTGEPLYQALEKCPGLVVVPPDGSVYEEASRKFVEILRQYTPVVEQYSIDEAWMDMTGTQRLWGPPILAADNLKNRIREELGFTVNIGISHNKLLAKMAGDLQKPDKVITLFPDELEGKFWPLPVEELFLVGKSTAKRLNMLGIYTIGDLATSEPGMLRRHLGKGIETVWHYANGRGSEKLTTERVQNKGYSHAVTLEKNVTDLLTADRILLELCDMVGTRLRKDEKTGSVLTVKLRTAEFKNYSHQSVLENSTDSTMELYRQARRIFREGWNGEPLRQMGIYLTRLSEDSYEQFDLFSGVSPEQQRKRSALDETMDTLRDKYGRRIICQAGLLRQEKT